MLRSFITAFLMYSKIPMPNIEWKDGNRRFSLGFFPMIGAVIGALLILWYFICDKLFIGRFLFSAVSVSLPILISGGIHLDGFCDVTDALHSYGDKNKKLEIMSDPHIGAFAVIYSVLYLILQFGLFTQTDTLKNTLIISFGYVLSRCMSALSALLFKSAKEKSSLACFVFPADKKVNIIMIIIFIAACLSALTFISPITAAAEVSAMTILFFCFKRMAYNKFGGVTGDLCGWLLQTAELTYLAAAVLTLKLTEVFL